MRKSVCLDTVRRSKQSVYHLGSMTISTRDRVVLRCGGRHGAWRSATVVVAVWLLLISAGCSTIAVPGFITQYEYDETLDLSLDGSATVFVNGSIPALIALHGLDLNPDPRVRIDRSTIRQVYTAPGVVVRRVSLSRRDARRFVHVALQVEDISRLAGVKPLAWSTYQLTRAGDEYAYVQQIKESARREIPGVRWTGRELVAFRVHLPSRVTFHNAGARNLRRGNVLVWEGLLADRLAAKPARFEARMDSESILYRTLWIFLLTFLSAVATLAFIVWLVMRQGRKTAPVAEGAQHV
jgi:hypothetical protein